MEKFIQVNVKDLHYLKAIQYHPTKPRIHFPFANYYDLNDIQFSVSRVLNGDLVTPENGFETHSHYDMEMFS